MPSPELTFRVISIGTLAGHPLWEERTNVRTGHATTTLITAGDTQVLVNPGLPPPVVEARLSERAGLTPDAISHVFLTSFQTDHLRSLERFPGATWLVHEPEREHAEAVIVEQAEQADTNGDAEVIAAVRHRATLLERCRVAEDKLVPGVDLFPLPGVTPGTCGLLLPLPRATVLIAGDAVATVEHLEQGKVLPTCLDIERAQESFSEAIEIADTLVLGRDNVVVNPLRR
ncbi:MAG: MBL fold metallo-hydrolase [Phycisphaerales bacterium]|nr:MBL fold metallo-hydrolase [Phycisphaerales bacterium]